MNTNNLGNLIEGRIALPKDDTTLIVGASGGPDSTLLLHALHQQGYKLVIAHVNYGLRGNESNQDEQFVRQLAEQLRIPFECKRVTSHPHTGKQAWARDLRFEFFKEVATKYDTDIVALGHTGSDNAETIFLHIFRGAGLDGLQGMQQISINKTFELMIVRPLLHLTRGEVMRTLKQHRIKYRIDGTNLKNAYTRNIIRNQLIPIINQTMQVNVVTALNNLAQHTNEIAQYVDKQLDQHKNAITKSSPQGIEMSIIRLAHIPEQLQKQFIKRAIEQHIELQQALSTKHIDAIVQLMKNVASGKQIHVGNALIVHKEYDTIRIQKRRETASFRTSTINNRVTKEIISLGEPLSIDAIHSLPIIAKPIKHIGQSTYSHNRIVVDQAKTGDKLILRSKEPGDFFYPAGMKGSKKLQDFFVDQKVPRHKRNKLKVLTTIKGEIVWIPGYRADQRFLANASSKQLVELEFVARKPLTTHTSSHIMA
jgi:tRNA(Ile)-lysidine synthase